MLEEVGYHNPRGAITNTESLENAMVERVRVTYAKGAESTEAEILHELDQPWLLMLDDAGTPNVKSQDWYQSLLFGIVDARSRTRDQLS